MRTYYSAKVSDFLNTPNNNILGELLICHNFSNDIEQKRAWEQQISILKSTLKNFLPGHLFFEFSIPRLGKRIDNVLILNGIIYLLEFKVYSKSYDSYAFEQVVDYALDLKNFHKGSHNKTIIPILVATDAPNVEINISFNEDDIAAPIKANSSNLANIIQQIDTQYNRNSFNEIEWLNSSYKPTPTIVEAAQRLYSNHSVSDISRNDSGAQNLALTTQTVLNVIKASKENNRKSICFITGVPGSGKTLAGLNIATQSMNCEEDEHACFLSGNGPLVKVLREALIRDKAAREKIPKKKAEHQVFAFIQNIHHFRDCYFEELNAPAEKVVIFDEAQRAWNKEQASKFMTKKHKISDFDFSEPEFLVGVMDRHKDWCTIICLIGGGQEINTGEAGLTEWFATLKIKYPHWDIYCASAIKNDEYLSTASSEYLNSMNIIEKDELHLQVD